MHEYGFDMTYNWQLKDIMNNIASGKSTATKLVEYYSTELDFYNRNDYRMTFTSNHDENSWHTSAVKRLGDGLEAFTVLTFTVQGMPLIYSGQGSDSMEGISYDGALHKTVTPQKNKQGALERKSRWSNANIKLRGSELRFFFYPNKR